MSFSDGGFPGDAELEEPTEEQRLATLIDLLGKSGDSEGAAKYQLQLDELRRSHQEANLSVGQATQRVKQTEAALKRVLERFEWIEAQYRETQAEVEKASAGRGRAG